MPGSNQKEGKDYFVSRLKALGFKEGKEPDAFISDTTYKITVSVKSDPVEASEINFGEEIIVHHKGACNFSRPENFVVLECVLRLLKKDYPPSSIELEKTWKLGHKGKGRLDIFVRKKKTAFAMIECKTWGEEYLRERDNLLEDGGQLFSYYIQERPTQALLLYSSKIENGKPIFQSEAIDTSKLSGANLDELHKSWDKSFIRDGIFHESATAFNSQKRNLKKSDLRELDRESGRGLFNSFAEILRRHVISDKSNAFNKIFNLFVCKIYDEDTKRPDDELEFQWKISDSFPAIIERLSNLYMRGLKDYLAIQITKEHFSPYTEFAFVDIFNKDSFETNFTVVKEVVELLQGYQIKYTSKHQFLGEFFEKLLNTGIKQEAGQFFTPIPLARFFLRSLPIASLIENNIRSKRQDVLPYILDYACGSGHFLTEAIDEVEEHIAQVDTSQLVGRIQKHFLAIKENFYWAKDYIYGIEKDYRLAKTTKIALFLNGDGDAKIVNGDGLDDFYQSQNYVGLLKTSESKKFNEQFDIIVSNPPFSIAGFKRYLPFGKENFSLFPCLTVKSTEIECLFFERLAHLLREDACAGIILPLSVVNSDVGIYVSVRIKMLIGFDLVGIIELRDKTFSETNTTTVGVFLRKRSRKRINEALEVVFAHYVKGKRNSKVTAAIAHLNEHSPEVSVDGADIITFFSDNKIDEANLETCDFDTEKLPRSFVLLLMFLLNNDRDTVIAYTGEKKEQEEFLGYRFSKSRGREGIELIVESGVLNSALYDPKNPDNPDKLNSHIKANFLGKRVPVPTSLEKRACYVSTLSLLETDTYHIKNPSGFFESEHLVIKTNSRLGDVIDDFPQTSYQLSDFFVKKDLLTIDGLMYNKGDEVPRKTKNRVITASNLDLKIGRLDLNAKVIYLRETFKIPDSIKPQRGDIIVSKASGSLKHLGKCVYVNENVDAAVGGFLFILRPANEKLGKALFYRLLSVKFRQFVASLRDQNINNMSIADMAKFPLTLPTDMDAFFTTITEKENELEALEEELRKLERK